MRREVTLKDGTRVVIRTMTEDDLDRSFEFFLGAVAPVSMAALKQFLGGLTMIASIG